MRLLLAVAFILAGLRWANWKNWKEYYPTILFMTLVSALVSIITSNHPLWLHIDTPFASASLNSLFVTFTCFPPLVMLYLSHYPNDLLHQVRYIIAWAIISIAIEFSMYMLGLIIYEHGWNFAWSILFNFVMFPLLRIHYLKPHLAWVLSLAFAIFILVHFGFSINMLK